MGQTNYVNVFCLVAVLTSELQLFVHGRPQSLTSCCNSAQRQQSCCSSGGLNIQYVQQPSIQYLPSVEYVQKPVYNTDYTSNARNVWASALMSMASKPSGQQQQSYQPVYADSSQNLLMSVASSPYASQGQQQQKSYQPVYADSSQKLLMSVVGNPSATSGKQQPSYQPVYADSAGKLGPLPSAQLGDVNSLWNYMSHRPRIVSSEVRVNGQHFGMVPGAPADYYQNKYLEELDKVQKNPMAGLQIGSDPVLNAQEQNQQHALWNWYSHRPRVIASEVRVNGEHRAMVPGAPPEYYLPSSGSNKPLNSAPGTPPRETPRGLWDRGSVIEVQDVVPDLDAVLDRMMMKDVYHDTASMPGSVIIYPPILDSVHFVDTAKSQFDSALPQTLGSSWSMQQIMDDPQKKALLQQMYFHGRGQGKYGDPADHLIVMADDPIIVDDMAGTKSTGGSTTPGASTEPGTTAAAGGGEEAPTTAAADGATTEAAATEAATTEAAATEAGATEAPADGATTEAPADGATTEAPAADGATTEAPAADGGGMDGGDMAPHPEAQQ